MKKKIINIAGLTLVEILIAIVITSLMMGAMVTSYNLVNNSYRQVADRAKISQAGRDIVGTMLREIRMAGFKYMGDLIPITNEHNPIKIYKETSGTSGCDVIEIVYGGHTYDIGTSISSFSLPVSASAQSGTTLKYYDLDINGGGAAQVPSLNINSVLPEEVQRYFKARNSSNQVDYEAVDGVDREIIGLTSISLDINIEYSEIIDVGRWRDGVEKDKTNNDKIFSSILGNLS